MKINLNELVLNYEENYNFIFSARNFSIILKNYLSQEDKSDIDIDYNRKEISICFTLNDSLFQISNLQISITNKLEHKLNSLNDSMKLLE